MHFPERRYLNFEAILTEICSQESNWQKIIIGSANGLVKYRWQVIIWTKEDTVKRHHVIALDYK